MKFRILSVLFALALCAAPALGQSLVISQYTETDSGTSPKGIELWNVSGSPITFDSSSNLLDIKKGVNGGAPASDIQISSGTLAAGGVLVVGTSDMSPDVEKSFTFNGDDALVIELGGVVQDVFGDPGSDPGASWTGNGVSTANSNIQLKDGITTGDTDGWTDPSERFETVGAGTVLTGFGTAPSGGAAPTTNVLFASASGSAAEDAGTYVINIRKSLAEGTISGVVQLGGTATLTADYTVSPTNFTLDGATTQATVTVTIVDDEDEESSETVTLTLANVSGGTIASPSVHTLTITDNDGSAPTTSLVISQYTETDSGTSPKGIELWNVSGSPITFDSGANLLDIKKGVNGDAPASDIQITSGTLAAGDVLVVGTSDMSPDVEKSFTFNGDDALVVELGGVVQDVFGDPGDDPGVEWAGSGVSTMNQNIQLKDGITAGDPDGWTDPSERFETVDAGSVQTGFGTAPSGGAAPTTNVLFATASGSAAEDAGTYVINVRKSLAEGTISGEVQLGGTATLTADYTVSPTNFTLDGATTQATVTVTIVDDEDAESSESVTLTLANVSGGTIGTPSVHTLTITDNDGGGSGDGVTNYFAVIAGISDYEGSINDLDYCDDDAEDLYAALQISAFWAPENMILLTDSAATETALRSAVTNLGAQADADDVFLFFFSGHGDQVSDVTPLDEGDGYDEALCPYNLQTQEVLDDELSEWLGQVGTDRIIVLLDTCFSGGNIKATGKRVKSVNAASDSVGAGDGFLADLTARGLDDVDDLASPYAATACDDDEYSYEDPALQHGIFTYFLLESMENADDNSNDLVSGEEAFDYLYPLVVAEESTQHPQEYDAYPGQAEFSEALSGSGGGSVTGLVISQYTETDTGTMPKGIELWNVSGSTITFDSGASLLDIKVGVNGGTPSSAVTVESGSLANGAVMVIGTSNMMPDVEEPFTFNGDDSLVIELGGVVQDVFGNPGSDPGSSWDGNGVSTANQNIQLKSGIVTGDPDGWTDPSERFETVDIGSVQTGFGTAPSGGAAPTTNVLFASASGSAAEDAGTYVINVRKSLAEGTISGEVQLGGTATLTADYTVSPTNFTLDGATTQATVTVTIVDDEDEESSETVTLTLANVSGGAIGTPSVHTLTITDNDGSAPTTSLVISQYTETDSGTSPKGIELWNVSGSPITFDSGANLLDIKKGVNGDAPASDIQITSGTLAAGDVLVVGTSDMSPDVEKSFTFNGDDALVVELGGVVQDVFGDPGDDPGVEWAGSGVSTMNQNIQLKDGIVTGDPDGWTDPSERFETVDAGSVQTGFGTAPSGGAAPTTNVLFASASGSAAEDAGTYVITVRKSLAEGTVSGEVQLGGTATLTADYTVSPTNFTLDGATTQATVTVTIVDDEDEESSETVTLTLANVSGGAIASPSVHTLTINDNDTPAPEGAAIWINEVNYDTPGTDSNEFVEIAGPAGASLEGYALELYNGAYDVLYNTIALSGTIDDEGCGYGALAFDTPGIQNGGPDGVALIDAASNLVQFLSYEGTMTPTNGVAVGQLSEDIGEQYNAEDTLQLGGTGTNYAQYAWETNTVSKGSLNANQTITGCGADPTTNVLFATASGSAAEDAGTYVITVRKSLAEGTISGEVQLGGTATLTADYTVSPTNFTLDGATTQATVTVTIVDDEDEESSETVTLTLANVSGGTIASPSVHTLTITDNDGSGPVTGLLISQYTETDTGSIPKGIELWNASGSTITFDSGANLLDIKVGVNGAAPASVATVESGSLANGAVMVIGTSNMMPDVEEPFTFNGDDALVIELGGVVQDVFGDPGDDPGDEWAGSGVSTRNQNIQLKDGITAGDTDGWTDPSERFETVDIGSVLTGFGEAPAGGTAPTTNVLFASASGSAAEDAGTYVITVRKSLAEGTISGEVQIGGTATITADYTVSPTNFTLDGATTQATVTVTIVDDEDEESSETVTLTLVNVSGGTIASPSVHTLTITDDDAPPPPALVLWINEVNYDAPGGDSNEFVEVAGLAGQNIDGFSLVLYNGGSGEYYDSVGLSGTIDDEGCGYGALAFDTTGIQNGSPDGVALVDATSNLIQYLCYEGSFTATDGAAAGETGEDIGTQTSSLDTLQLGGMGTNYADFAWETNTMSMGSLNVNQTIAGCGAEPPTNVLFASASGSVAESVGTYEVIIRKSLAQGTVSGELQLGGTATLTADYTVSPTNFTLDGATTQATVTVTVVDDEDEEADETVTLTLANVSGGAISSPSVHTLTIQANDSPVVTTNVLFATASGSAAEDAGTYEVIIRKSPAQGTVSGVVQLGGTATLTADYTVSPTNFTLDGATTQATVTVTVVDDEDEESDETVILTIANVLGGTIASPSTHTLTINDNDGASPSTVFLSELCDPAAGYVDNRYVEIYNHGCDPVNLSGWTVAVIANGATGPVWNLSGTLASGEAKVCGKNTNPEADFGIGWTNDPWNGSSYDGAELRRDGALIDYVFSSDLNYFADSSLVRTQSVAGGSTTFVASEWTKIAAPAIGEGGSTPGVHLCLYPMGCPGAATPVWIVQHWGSTNLYPGDYRDTDGDGQNNIEEYIANTAPTNGNSFFEIGGEVEGGSRVLRIPTWDNRLYRLQYRSNLTDVVWYDLLAEQSGTNGILTVPEDSSALSRFYRCIIRMDD